MRISIRRRFWDFEKTEQWLNEMAARGMNMVAHSPGMFSFDCFTFEEGTPGEYCYRYVTFEFGLSKEEVIHFVRFLEESDIEHVSTDSWYSGAFFRKRVSDGAFEIYSDLNSRIKHHKRKATLFAAVLGTFVIFVALQIWVILWNSASAWSVVNIGVIIFITLFSIPFAKSFYREIKRTTQLKYERNLQE